MDKKERRTNYMYDCSSDLFNVGDAVYYLDKKGEVRIGTVTRIRIEIDGKTLQNSYNVKSSYIKIKEVKEAIQNG